MAVQKIDYENKIGLQNDENVPDKNKVTDEDMNQIKSKVNNNADELSTAQQNIEDLQEGQGTASSEITSLENRVTTLEKDNTKNKQDIANKVDKVEGKGLSTEDYTTAEKEKLAGLKNYDDAEIKKDIQDLESDVSDIKSEQETQNDLLQRTQSALINITTEKSDCIHVEDSSNLTAKIDVYGTSSQKTREGYNLLNVASTCEITGSKTVPISMPAGNYTIKADDITTDSEQTQFCFSFRDSSGTIADARISLSTKKITFALTREATSVNIYSGNSFSESQGVTTTYKNLMIYEGADDKTYEEYGASPSPEFPSEIENVTGDIDITVCNKNLFTGFTKGKGLNDTTGEETTNSTGAVSNFIEVGFSKNSNYYLSGLTNTLNSYIAAYNKNKEFLGRIGANAQTNISFNKDSFTLYSAEGDIAFVRVTQYEIITSTGTIDDIDDLNVQLEANNVATDFVKHEQQLITFPLQEGQRLADGDKLASDGIHHKRTQVEIKGTETQWIYYSANDVWARPYLTFTNKKIGESNNTANALCNKAKSISWEEMYQNIDEVSVFTYEGDNRISIAIKKEDLETQDTAGVKKYFQENNMVVEYNLEEEEIEPYTPEQQEAYNKLQNVLAYKLVTNVLTDKALLEFKYVADTQTWVVNEIKPLKEQLNTINQLLSTTGTSATLLDNLQKDLESEVL